MSDTKKAVFVSYAREDIASARRIAAALHAAGLEVWFDEDELRGGDSWDAKIRQQIRDCALFMPMISAHTQARAEGYFRVEWRLADRRTESIGKSKAFLVPVCIDDTGEAHADVPDSFLAVQWTRLPAGETPRAFCERVSTLLHSEVGSRGPSQTRLVSGAPNDSSVRPNRPPATRAPRHVIAWAVAVLVVAGVGIWQPWRNAARQAAVPKPASSPALSPMAAEVARLRARLIPHTWKKEDFEPWSAAIDRVIAADDQNADAWALRSIINSLQVMRSFVADTKPLEAGRVAANRALHLAPGSPLGELALGMHHAAMISRGGDAQAARPHLRLAFEALPADALTRYADLTTAYHGFDFEQVERAAKAWLKSDPGARLPAYILGLTGLVRRNHAEAIMWSEQAASDQDITGMRSYVVGFDAEYYLRGDLPTARKMLDRIPTSARTAHRVLYACWLLAMAEGRWDLALQELARTPEAMFYESTYYGPKALLSGLAHQAAGRGAAALPQFREAERVLREQLAADPHNEPLHAVLAVTLAHAGQLREARSELALVEPLARGRPRTYASRMMAVLAQANAALGDTEPTLYWLRQLLCGPVLTAFTPASLRIDPRFRPLMAKPEVQALLTEFAHLDARPLGSSAAANEKSIAVLAFKAIGDDKESEIFSEGVSEELLNVLAKVSGLRVAARASAFYFKDKNATTQEMGHKLNVAYLVEGSVQRVGTMARVNARLSRADTGEQIWSEKFDEQLKNILALQDEIAGRIAENLKLKLGYAPRIAKTVAPEAHRLALEGWYFWHQRKEENFTRAEVAFKRALEIDPKFAQAHAGLANNYVIRAQYRWLDGIGSAQEGMAQAQAEAQRAIDLDPTVAEAHAALAYASANEGRWADSERHFQTAFTLNPSYAMAMLWHSQVLGSRGRLDLALQESRRAVELDPLAFIVVERSAEILRHTGLYAEALAASLRAAGLRSDVFLPSLGEQTQLLSLLGREAEAISVARAIRKDRSERTRWTADGYAIWTLERAGLHHEAEDHEKELAATPGGTGYARGFALAALGRFEDALPFLEMSPPIVFRRLYCDLLFDPFRAEPRFQQLLVKLGCAAEYKVARETLGRIQKDNAAKK